MLTKVELRNVLGQSIEINELTASPTYPLNQFNVDVDQRMEEHERMQQHGIWPAYTYDGAMTIHMEGDILAANSPAYVAARRALVDVVRINPLLTVTDRRRGTLIVRFDGEAEDWQADYGKCELDAPLAALSPGRTTFMLELRCFLPYFTGAVTGNPYYWE